MKKLFVSCLGVLLATSGAFATTKTVSQAGDAEFTSIQEAIDSFTDAERSDGEPDEVVVMDSATYDEQVILGGLPPADGASAGYLDDTIAFNATADPFTLRGNDPENRPVINPTSGPATSYGVFTGDPGDSFTAVLSFMGKDFTVENIEVRTNGSVGEYGANGQAGNMVFNNVLFGRSGDTQDGDSLINLNNDVTLVDDGFDNSYTFNSCSIDGTVGEGERFGSAGIYFHGWGNADDITGAGFSVDEVATSFEFVDCSFINCSDTTRIRGNGQANNITVSGAFMTGCANGFVAEGRGSFTITDSIFYMNGAQSGDFSEDLAMVHTDGRGGATPLLSVSNSLFVDNLDPIEFGDDATGFNTRAAVVRIENDGEDQEISFENNTFVNNPIVFRFADGSARPRTGTISNNIFQNSVVALTGSDSDNPSYAVAAPEDAQNLDVDGTGNVFDTVGTVVEEQEIISNVEIEGTESTVEFENTEINMDDPFAGPPYQVVSGADNAGADLGDTTDVSDYPLY